MNRAKTVALLLISALAFAACQKEGPAERAGREVDRSVQKAGQAIESAGEKVQEAARDGKK